MRRALVVSSLLMIAACGEAPPSTVVPDAREPDAGPPRHLTVVMALVAGAPRRLPDTLPPSATFTLTTTPQHGALDIYNGVVRQSNDGTPQPYVERVAAVDFHDPNFTVDFVFVVGGAVFLGRVNGDATLPANWDLVEGELDDAAWVFVPEAPIASVAATTAHAHDVIVDGATVRVNELAVHGARFACTGRLEPSDQINVSRITITDGTAAGTVPMFFAEGTVGLAADVATERIVVQPGATVTVAAGQVLDTGIGESFVQPGGLLRVAGHLINGRDVTVSGTLATTTAATALDLTRLEDRGTIELAAGTLTVSTLAEIWPEGAMTIGAGATATITDDLFVDGALVNHGTLHVGGALEIRPGATLVNDGTITAGVCRSNGVVDAPPCP